jgi:hypothetical protein
VILAVVCSGLYVYDYSGALETVWGRVERVRTYTHQASGGPHTHTEAVIEFEDRRHALPRADQLTRGMQVLVDVRRGRLSGRPRFVAFRGTEDGTSHSSEVGAEPKPDPWQYDPTENQYWHPYHAHWHDGRPPPPEQR